jgi:hypothetical protein
LEEIVSIGSPPSVPNVGAAIHGKHLGYDKQALAL